MKKKRPIRRKNIWWKKKKFFSEKEKKFFLKKKKFGPVLELVVPARVSWLCWCVPAGMPYAASDPTQTLPVFPAVVRRCINWQRQEPEGRQKKGKKKMSTVYFRSPRRIPQSNQSINRTNNAITHFQSINQSIPHTHTQSINQSTKWMNE